MSGGSVVVPRQSPGRGTQAHFHMLGFVSFSCVLRSSSLSGMSFISMLDLHFFIVISIV